MTEHLDLCTFDVDLGPHLVTGLDVTVEPLGGIDEPAAFDVPDHDTGRAHTPAERAGIVEIHLGVRTPPAGIDDRYPIVDDGVERIEAARR
ncbi:MAG: hypothetical protein H0X05_06270, partial [Actinobacteria bacterium]|nr:hypothetical protein [Actinomycetota bacterium]